MMAIAGGGYAQEQKSVHQLADEAYAREEYAVAGALYQRQARKGDKTPLNTLLKMAHSFRETGRYNDAAAVYQQLIARPGHPAGVYFEYGETLRQLEQYDAARQQYVLFTTANADSLRLKTIGLQSCDSAAVWMKAGPAVQLTPMKALNTPGSDLVSGTLSNGLLLMSNGYRTLINAEHRPDKDLRTQYPYYKVYTYQQNTQGNPVMYLDELAAELVGKYDFHVGPVCLNKAEDTLYATLNIQGKDIPVTSRKGPVNGVRQLQVFQSVKIAGKWGKLVLLPGINVTGYSSSHAVLNSEGSVLYFVSDRPGGIGETDIWYAEKQEDGNWGEPVNCGRTINTVAAETFPTINEDGLLYFSSKGFPGLGGYDIYRTKGEKAQWEMPENMKAPINSGADELGLVVARNGKQAYMASGRPGGAGSDDIYAFTIQAKVNPVTQPAPQPAATYNNADEAADKHTLESLKLFYDYKSASLVPASKQLLDEVAAILKRRPDWKLTIASFADSRGGYQYNMDLSALRCLSVIDYLGSKGIDPRRLYYSNKGELEPVNKCKDGVSCNEEEHAANRRSELEVK